MRYSKASIWLLGLGLVLSVAGCSSKGVEPENQPPVRTFLVGSDEGIHVERSDGSGFVLNPNFQGQVEVLGDRIFTKRTETSSDTIFEIGHSGAVIGAIPIPAAIPYPYQPVVLPDTGFAFLDNASDRIDFMDHKGNYLGVVAMPDSSPEELQVVKGIVVGNNLIVSETGTRKIIRVDLTTHDAFIFKDLSNLSGWLGDIAYYDGYCYVCQADKVLRFTQTGDATQLCAFPEEKTNLVGISIIDDYAYVVINCFPSEMYKISLKTGKESLVTSGFGYPESITYIPVDLNGPYDAP